MAQLDWRPETRSLLGRLLDAGFKIVESSDGEETFKHKTLKDTIDTLTSVDTAWLTARRAGSMFTLMLVYGNSPGELVCDYSWPSDVDGAPLDAVLDAHCEAWEGRIQPTTKERAPV